MARVVREVIGTSVLYLADIRDVPLCDLSGTVVCDPPYPNSAGHFIDGVADAIWFLSEFKSDHWLIFWTEMEIPPCRESHVATHIWHRSNSNRPDNYEAIFEFHVDGKKRASRVMSHHVVYPGMTGIEATGHPTEKNVSLMREIVSRTNKSVIDPFMGSGSTGVACVKEGRQFIGVEKDQKWHSVACRRIEMAYRQTDLFPTPVTPYKQNRML